MLVVGILVLAVLGPPALLTMRGAVARGLPIPLAILAGLFFPVTWAHWYLVDEHPYRRRETCDET